MGTQYLSTSRVSRSPGPVQAWNCSIRAGDDFKLAVTVYGDDAGTPAVVSGSASQILLWPDQLGFPHSCDYGFGWASGGSPVPGPLAGWVQQIVGFTTPVRAGGINFALQAANTLALRGRYHLAMQVDLPDGSFTQVEGILQVRPSFGLPVIGHTASSFFTLDSSVLDGPAVLAPIDVDGVSLDMDGFPLIPVDTSSGVIVPPAPIVALTVASLTALLNSLPTTLPGTAGVLWNDGGALALS